MAIPDTLDDAAAGLGDAWLAALLEAIDDAVIGLDSEGRIIDWNGGAERLFGHPQAEALGHPVARLAVPGREGELAGILERARAGDRTDRLETQLRKRSGSIVDVALTVSPVQDRGGQVVGTLVIAGDITDRKRAQAEQALLSAIIQSTDDAVISKDLNGIITSWNRGAGVLLGYGPEETIGRHVSMLAPPDRSDEMPRILKRIQRGERLDHFDTVRRRKDGTLIDVSLTVSPILDASGRIIGASKIARDIRDRKRAAERQLLLVRELDHRAKNILAVVQAMIRLSRADTLADYIQITEGRIQALARVHSEVAANRWGGADLETLARNGLAPFASLPDRLFIAGPRVWLTPAGAQVLGIVLHELATNAVKHGAWSNGAGRVSLTWSCGARGEAVINWLETGGPPVTPPSRVSFGTTVIQHSIADQLQGSARLDWPPSGLDASFTIPATHLAQQDGADGR